MYTHAHAHAHTPTHTHAHALAHTNTHSVTHTHATWPIPHRRQLDVLQPVRACTSTKPKTINPKP